MNQKGFTLVVTSIIGLLGIIILNSLSKAKEKADKSIDCKSKIELRAKYFPKECLGFLENYLK